MFARSIGGGVGVAIMGAIFAAGLGGSHRLTPADFEGAGLAGLSPELRQSLIASLQRAFSSGTVAAGLAFVASFWVPPFAGDITPNAGQEMPGAQTSTAEVRD
jgi:hypothetical protein